MENQRTKEENIIKDIRNVFRIKKEIKGIRDIVLRSIKNLFEYKKEEENYYKPVRVNNFSNNNYIEHKNDGDKNKILSVEEYLNEIRQNIRDLVNDLKQSDTWKIQLTITVTFSSSKDQNDEDRIMQSKSDNIEIMRSDEGDEVIKKLFDSLENRYQNNLESVRGSEFVFNYVQLLYYKFRKINFNRVGFS